MGNSRQESKSQHPNLTSLARLASFPTAMWNINYANESVTLVVLLLPKVLANGQLVKIKGIIKNLMAVITTFPV